MCGLCASGTIRRINKSKPLHESVQQTLLPLQIPCSVQEISPSARRQDKQTPQENKQRRTMWNKMQLQQQQSTQQKENAASVSTVWSELCLRCILVGAWSQRRSPNHFLHVSTFIAPVWSQEARCSTALLFLFIWELKLGLREGLSAARSLLRHCGHIVMSVKHIT